MTRAPTQQEKLVRQLELFRERLLDIDTRNPSLRLRRETQERAFDLVRLGTPTVNSVYTRLARGSASVRLVADTDDSPEAAKVRVHLRKLWRASQSRTDETGLKELYLGVCWLTGHLDAKSFVRGPMFVVPAALELKRAPRASGWYLALQEQELMVNEAMIAAIRKHRGLRLSPDLSDDALEQLAKLAESPPGKADIAAEVFTRLGCLVVAAGLQCETAAYSQQPLAPQANSDIGNQSHPLYLVSHLALGIFPQSSTALYGDMETMSERAAQGEVDQGIVDNLLEAPADQDQDGEGPSGPMELDAFAEARVHTVIAADPSQFSVVAKAQSAECLVVRGPPGTGKSQVIVNLVADALARGKRVLVVCQKRPAIDVVYDRLNEHELGSAAAVVHDATSDRAALYKKLLGRLQQTSTRVPRGRTYEQLGVEIDGLTHQLRTLVGPLASELHGLRLYEIYGRARTGFQSRLDVPAEIVSRAHAELPITLMAIEAARAGALRFDHPAHPLASRIGLHRLANVERPRVLESFARLLSTAREGPGVLIPPGPARDALRSSIDGYERLQDRWYRLLTPAWWLARRCLRRFRRAFGEHSVSQWRALLDRGARFAGLLAELGATMSEAWQAEVQEELGTPDRIAARASASLHALQESFDEIVQHDYMRSKLDPAALALLARCTQTLSGQPKWDDHVDQEILLRWIDEAEMRFPVLRGFGSEEYERSRSMLESKLDEKRTAVARQLSHSLDERARTPSFDPREAVRGNRKPASDWNRLAHELGKQRRIKPVRALVHEFSWQMRQIVPCWLTSPEVASELFPLERGYFDLVIFDEASQLPLERALPVLYRAKQVVIAGDEQQMPPSRFFVASVDEEEEPGDPDESPDDGSEARFADSLLSQAKRVYGFDYLAWHYRSRHQELIEFSNHAFYEGRLCVAANLERLPASRPIRWVDARGTWQNNTNPIEVAAAVDELARVLSQSDAPPSVGIITFNQKQREAIEHAIDARADEDANFRECYERARNPKSGKDDDKPFVKNIENVQGDERDHIIFSIGYGPGPDGVFRRVFGPLSLSGGENRLNVAATRARLGITVVCSFDPDTLATDGTKNRGPALLKRYLQYARAVSANDRAAAARVLAELGSEQYTPAPARHATFESPFEERVYHALQQRGYQLETQWGAGGYRIDLAVVDPNEPSRFCLGIECDGATYHSARSVRERDIARQAFLESRGWTIHRIWSRDFWKNPQREIEAVVARLPKARKHVPQDDQVRA